MVVNRFQIYFKKHFYYFSYLITNKQLKLIVLNEQKTKNHIYYRLFDIGQDIEKTIFNCWGYGTVWGNI